MSIKKNTNRKNGVPEFKGYNKPTFRKGKIKDIVCENIERQPLEKAKDKRELFYYNKKKIKVRKGNYIRYGLREKEVLNDLLINGFVFYMFPLKFHNMIVIRKLKLKGHLIKAFRFNSKQTGIKNKIQHFILVYYIGKEKEAFDGLLKKFPQLKNTTNYLKKFEVPLKRNLHSLATERAIRWRNFGGALHSEKICFCGTKFTDYTKNQSRKYCSLKCLKETKRKRAKEWRRKKVDKIRIRIQDMGNR